MKPTDALIVAGVFLALAALIEAAYRWMQR